MLLTSWLRFVRARFWWNAVRRPRRRTRASARLGLPEALEARTLLSGVSAQPDVYHTPADQALASTVSVLANDPGATSGSSASLTQNAAHGSVSLNADGTFSYTPATGYTGVDQFQYVVQVGGDSSAATQVSIFVGDVAGDDTTTSHLLTGQSARAAGQIGDNANGAYDVDFYRITLNAGDSVRLDVDAAQRDNGTSLSSLDSHLRVFDEWGYEVAANGNGVDPQTGQASNDSALTFSASSSGTYYIGLSAAGNEWYSTYGSGSGSGEGSGSGGSSSPGLAYELQVDVTPRTPLSFTQAEFEYTLPLNSSYEAVVGTLSVADADGGSLYFSSSSSSWPFTVDSMTGQIRVYDSYALQVGTTYTFEVTAQDSYGSATTAVSILVTPSTNQPPAFTESTFEFSVPRDVQPYATVGQIAATDAEGDYRLYWATDNSSPFSVESDGSIRVNDPWSLTVGQTYTFGVMVADAWGQDAATVSVTIAPPLNQPPQFTQTTFSYQVESDALYGAAVGTPVANDPEGDSLNWMTAESTGPFLLDWSTGAITVSDPTQLVEGQTHTFSVTVADAYGSATALISIEVVAPGSGTGSGSGSGSGEGSSSGSGSGEGSGSGSGETSGSGEGSSSGSGEGSGSTSGTGGGSTSGSGTEYGNGYSGGDGNPYGSGSSGDGSSTAPPPRIDVFGREQYSPNIELPVLGGLAVGTEWGGLTDPYLDLLPTGSQRNVALSTVTTTSDNTATPETWEIADAQYTRTTVESESVTTLSTVDEYGGWTYFEHVITTYTVVTTFDDQNGVTYTLTQTGSTDTEFFYSKSYDGVGVETVSWYVLVHESDHYAFVRETDVVETDAEGGTFTVTGLYSSSGDQERHVRLGTLPGSAASGPAFEESVQESYTGTLVVLSTTAAASTERIEVETSGGYEWQLVLQIGASSTLSYESSGEDDFSVSTLSDVDESTTRTITIPAAAEQPAYDITLNVSLLDTSHSSFVTHDEFAFSLTTTYDAAHQITGSTYAYSDSGTLVSIEHVDLTSGLSVSKTGELTMMTSTTRLDSTIEDEYQTTSSGTLQSGSLTGTSEGHDATTLESDVRFTLTHDDPVEETMTTLIRTSHLESTNITAARPDGDTWSTADSRHTTLVGSDVTFTADGLLESAGESDYSTEDRVTITVLNASGTGPAIPFASESVLRTEGTEEWTLSVDTETEGATGSNGASLGYSTSTTTASTGAGTETYFTQDSLTLDVNKTTTAAIPTGGEQITHTILQSTSNTIESGITAWAETSSSVSSFSLEVESLDVDQDGVVEEDEAHLITEIVLESTYDYTDVTAFGGYTEEISHLDVETIRNGVQSTVITDRHSLSETGGIAAPFNPANSLPEDLQWEGHSDDPTQFENLVDPGFVTMQLPVDETSATRMYSVGTGGGVFLDGSLTGGAITFGGLTVALTSASDPEQVVAAGMTGMRLHDSQSLRVRSESSTVDGWGTTVVDPENPPPDAEVILESDTWAISTYDAATTFWEDVEADITMFDPKTNDLRDTRLIQMQQHDWTAGRTIDHFMSGSGTRVLENGSVQAAEDEVSSSQTVLHTRTLTNTEITERGASITLPEGSSTGGEGQRGLPPNTFLQFTVFVPGSSPWTDYMVTRVRNYSGDVTSETRDRSTFATESANTTHVLTTGTPDPEAVPTNDDPGYTYSTTGSIVTTEKSEVMAVHEEVREASEWTQERINMGGVVAPSRQFGLMGGVVSVNAAPDAPFSAGLLVESADSESEYRTLSTDKSVQMTTVLFEGEGQETIDTIAGSTSTLMQRYSSEESFSGITSGSRQVSSESVDTAIGSYTYNRWVELELDSNLEEQLVQDEASFTTSFTQSTLNEQMQENSGLADTQYSMSDDVKRSTTSKLVRDADADGNVAENDTRFAEVVGEGSVTLRIEGGAVAVRTNVGQRAAVQSADTMRTVTYHVTDRITYDNGDEDHFRHEVRTDTADFEMEVEEERPQFMAVKVYRRGSSANHSSRTEILLENDQLHYERSETVDQQFGGNWKDPITPPSEEEAPDGWGLATGSSFSVHGSEVLKIDIDLSEAGQGAGPGGGPAYTIGEYTASGETIQSRSWAGWSGGMDGSGNQTITVTDAGWFDPVSGELWLDRTLTDATTQSGSTSTSTQEETGILGAGIAGSGGSHLWVLLAAHPPVTETTYVAWTGLADAASLDLNTYGAGVGTGAYSNDGQTWTLPIPITPVQTEGQTSGSGESSGSGEGSSSGGESGSGSGSSGSSGSPTTTTEWRTTYETMSETNGGNQSSQAGGGISGSQVITGIVDAYSLNADVLMGFGRNLVGNLGQQSKLIQCDGNVCWTIPIHGYVWESDDRTIAETLRIDYNTGVVQHGVIDYNTGEIYGETYNLFDMSPSERAEFDLKLVRQKNKAQSDAARQLSPDAYEAETTLDKVISAVGAAPQGAYDGLAMLSNAVTLHQIDSLSGHVDDIVAANGPMYQTANAAAHIAPAALAGAGALYAAPTLIAASQSAVAASTPYATVAAGAGVRYYDRIVNAAGTFMTQRPQVVEAGLEALADAVEAVFSSQAPDTSGKLLDGAAAAGTSLLPDAVESAATVARRGLKGAWDGVRNAVGMGRCTNFEGAGNNPGGCFVAGTLVRLSAFRDSSRIGSPADGARHVGTLVPIESVPLGSRVPDQNPLSEEIDTSLPDVDQATWRRVAIRLRRADGATVEMELLRPEGWVRKLGLSVGSTFDIRLSEFTVSGAALVTAIEPCGAIHEGDGSVVTGRLVTRRADNLVRVELESGTTFVGTTTHPIWMPERQIWKTLAELEEGDIVDTLAGPLAVARSERIQRIADVYNLEVHRHHIYRITQQGVLVHNNDTCFRVPKSLPDVRTLNPVADPARPVYERGHVGQPVVDHIKARAAGGHATDPNNLHVKPWEWNARKGAFEGQLIEARARYIQQGLTPEQADAVLASEWQWLMNDVLPRPMGPTVLDQIPWPGSY